MEKTSEEWGKVKEEFKEWYFTNEKKFSLVKNMYQSLLSSLLFDGAEITNPTIEGRVKDRNGCISKFERKYLQNYNSENISVQDVKKEITDLIGIRIICSYEDEIEKIDEIIQKNLEVLRRTDKTQELKETNEFGYKGLHLDVELKDDRKALDEYKQIAEYPVEIQIRTIIQHAWSSLEHKIIYKKNDATELTRAAKRLAALFEIADSEFIQLREKTRRIVEQSGKMIESTESSIQSSKETGISDIATTTMDFVTFNKFLNMKFDTNFFFSVTNSFLEEILRIQNDFTLEILLTAYEKENKIVESYKEANDRILSMNPLTQLRHILYGYDKEAYSRLLTDFQRKRFDEYLQNCQREESV